MGEYLHFRRFTVGYGLNAAWKQYTYRRPYPGFRQIDLGDLRIDDRYWAGGVTVAAYVNITPTFFRFGAAKPWQYEHSATLDLKFYLFRH